MAHIAIIGGGPAGYVAATAAVQSGSQVTLIEEKDLGGTCLNVGCVPTKALLESAEKVKKASTFGIELPDGQTVINWENVQGRKGQIVKQLVGGIGYLMKKNKITVKKGSASFLNSHSILIRNGGEKETLQADKFIIASGSEPVQLAHVAFHEGTVAALRVYIAGNSLSWLNRIAGACAIWRRYPDWRVFVCGEWKSADHR